MPKDIRFLDEETDFSLPRNCVTFPALVDGTRVLCVVSARLLVEKFRAATEDVGQLKKAYYSGKVAIQEAARQLIEAGKVNDRAELLITPATYP